MSLVHSPATGKSHLINLVDTLGHINLMDASNFGHSVGGWYIIGCGTSSKEINAVHSSDMGWCFTLRSFRWFDGGLQRGLQRVEENVTGNTFQPSLDLESPRSSQFGDYWGAVELNVGAEGGGDDVDGHRISSSLGEVENSFSDYKAAPHSSKAHTPSQTPPAPSTPETNDPTPPSTPPAAVNLTARSCPPQRVLGRGGGIPRGCFRARGGSARSGDTCRGRSRRDGVWDERVVYEAKADEVQALGFAGSDEDVPEEVPGFLGSEEGFNRIEGGMYLTWSLSGDEEKGHVTAAEDIGSLKAEEEETMLLRVQAQSGSGIDQFQMGNTWFLLIPY
ncbi:hypothetical protein GG344DRAFT_64760 [Lentinula edodes]|nr:hypothetical protein GG344DRAFT_64760 [Lentinula edodes]